MTQEDMIRMAREAFIARGFWPNEVMWACWRDAWLAGAAAENEACAVTADEHMQECEGKSFGVGKAIRARGQA
jgi:hypothetical protein